MKIALLGYGKMGKAVEKIALERGHEIVLRKSGTGSFDGLNHANVAIDFSIPDAAVTNISECLHNNIPVISGTTGWLENYSRMISLCAETNGAFIYGSNFSLGVNIFFELNRYLASMMTKFDNYSVGIRETHHTQKRDAPSGTAISLAADIIENSSYNDWSLIGNASITPHQIPVEALRIGDVPGTHSVIYNSDIDSIEIKHTAHNREGFALGAVLAAEWLSGKTGVFTMRDVLNL